MNVGFIGLGNVGGKLAGSLLRNKFNLTVRDLDKNLTKQFKSLGAKIAKSARKNKTTLKFEAIKTGLISAKDFDKIVDPRKMTYPA